MGFRLANLDGRAVLLAPDAPRSSEYYDLESASSGRLPAGPMAALARCAEVHSLDLSGLEPSGSLRGRSLGPPVPEPSKVFAIGLNYRSHAEESNLELPAVPMVFTKFPSCLVGPGAEVELRGERVDWEVELVVVIGEGGRDIPAAAAWQHVAGLTIGQDISDRKVQFSSQPPQFSMGKSFDTFGPIGPAVVSADLLGDPNDLAITCDVSGERKQDARTSDLIFSVADLVAYLSTITSLRSGDLIFTGTPAGVGAAHRDFLRDGDTIVSAIEGIGTMTNRCRAVA